MKHFLCACHKLSTLDRLAISVVIVIVYFTVSFLKAGT